MSRARCPTCGMETRAEGLTRREQDILDLLSEGKRQISIGVELGISLGTVSTHIDNIRKRLGVHGMYDLGRWELARRTELLQAGLREQYPERQKALKAFTAYAAGR